MIACVCVCLSVEVSAAVCAHACLCRFCAASALPCVGELCVSLLVGLCGGINSLVRRAWLPPRQARSSMFILHLRRLLADEDVHMQD